MWRIVVPRISYRMVEVWISFVNALYTKIKIFLSPYMVVCGRSMGHWIATYKFYKFYSHFVDLWSWLNMYPAYWPIKSYVLCLTWSFAWDYIPGFHTELFSSTILWFFEWGGGAKLTVPDKAVFSNKKNTGRTWSLWRLRRYKKETKKKKNKKKHHEKSLDFFRVFLRFLPCIL